ncbi:pyrroline-5-carboxylate reductase family protein [Methanovulcanius yangii]|uniref:pyrroline-5-carboxylate reductase family protein n=1 Tax=Methanovulcanius yangii TaxID=1789227 RepID=UPI0029CA51AA|nr:NAD(P)-binding domain-containing protein [Methanovulcanius yangii]
MTRIGIIGTGSMGRMLAHTFIDRGVATPADIIASSRSEGPLAALAAATGITAAADNREAARGADVLFLCVKPLQVRDVMAEIAPVCTPAQLVVSVAADVSLACLAAWTPARVARAIPTITSWCGRGITLLAFGDTATEADRERLTGLFGAISRPYVTTEERTGALTDLTSCGPAFIAAVAEEWAAAASRRTGIDRKAAEEMVRETLIGTALALDREGMTCAALIHEVATPAGITREGVDVLAEEMPDVWDAVHAATGARHRTLRNEVERRHPP